ncbi:conjugative transposon protein TraK [Mucilaginibacter sp. McL0603]|uniref:conjugative transposon protein TraK n=1 Tax=Mucilaginibacter sp. McL0603 TaxID=3415670 RepID=UPI003CF534B9
MFRQLKNIDTAFRQVRLFCLAVIICCLLICCFTIYKSLNLVQSMQSKVYILSYGKALEALAADGRDNVAVELRDHVKTFHRLFFTLDPDEKSNQQNITRALYLADGSAKKIYDDLSESGYYAGIISGNINQTIAIDSVSVDLSTDPFRFRCYATQNIIRTTSTVTRSLVTQGELRKVSRSDNNPHGFLIARWNILENKDIKIVNH